MPTTVVRETGLQVTVLDEGVNNWTNLVPPEDPGQDVNAFYLPANAGIHREDINFYGYRQGVAVCKATDGTIYRVRLGTPDDVDDRQIWWQTITDPTIDTQWNDWDVLYTGNNYGVDAVCDGNTLIVYHSRVGGLYVDDVLTWVPPTGVKAMWPHVVVNTTNSLFIKCLATETDSQRRRFDYWYTPDLDSVTPVKHLLNFRHYRIAVSAIKRDDDSVFILVESLLYGNTRDAKENGHTLWGMVQSDAEDIFSCNEPRIIRGISGGTGINYVTGSVIFKCSDGYYYIFYSELHRGTATTADLDDPSSSLGSGMFIWQRSLDCEVWSEPIIGPTAEGTTGPRYGINKPVEKNNVLYVVGPIHVDYRPIGTTSHDLTNYVPELEFEIPRDNQPASGSVTVANPGGVNDYLIGLQGKEIVIKPGYRQISGAFTFKQFDRFIIKRATREIDGATNRINIAIGNVWERLNNSFRDTLNFVGQTVYHDWGTDPDTGVLYRNRAFNYYFRSDADPDEDIDEGTLSTKGTVLYTGWKGINPDVAVHFNSSDDDTIYRLIARYVDNNNYVYLTLDGDQLELHERYQGTDTTINTWTVDDDDSPTLRLVLKWNYYQVFLNGDESGGISTHYYKFLVNQPGYVGFRATHAYVISHFNLTDWERPITLGDMCKVALGFGGFHDVTVTPGDADGPAYAIVWGPQTDVTSAAEGLSSTLDAGKLQMAYRSGALVIAKFTDATVVKTLQDEVIESTQVEETSEQINMAVVDGNDTSFSQVDLVDTYTRGQQLIGYFDLPELTDFAQIQARAVEEINRSKDGTSPGAKIPLDFTLERMDVVTLIDNQGNTYTPIRLVGRSVKINQSKSPTQTEELDFTSATDSNVSTEGDTPDGSLDDPSEEEEEFLSAIWQDEGEPDDWAAATDYATTDYINGGDDRIWVNIGAPGTSGGSITLTGSGDVNDGADIVWHLVDTWTALDVSFFGAAVQPTTPNGHWYSNTRSAASQTGSTEPVWITDGTTVHDPLGGSSGDSSILDVGGDPSIRGVQVYSLLTADATVASPYGLTQVHAARDAAGVDGVVRFPSAGSPYSMDPTMNVAGQTWQMEDATTEINGEVTIAANNLTFEGGIVKSLSCNRTPSAANFTLRNVTVQDSSAIGLQLQGGHDGWQVLNCEFYDCGTNFIHLWYDQPGDGDIHGFLIQDCIMIDGIDTDNSAIGGSDGDNLNAIYDFKIRNCYIDSGPAHGGGFGIEVWHHQKNTDGIGGIVEYCDLRGGDFLISMVRSDGNWIHHNILNLDPAYAAYESGGPNHENAVIEYNHVIGTGSGTFVYHDASSHDNLVQQNEVEHITWLVEGSGGGGAYTVIDNCTNDVDNIIGTSYSDANINLRNGAGEGPCA